MKKLKDILWAKRMTQKDLAEKTGLSNAAISRYINENRMPKGDNLLKIAKVLNISPNELLNINMEEE